VKCWIDIYDIKIYGGREALDGDPWQRMILITEEGMAFQINQPRDALMGWYYNDNQREWLLRYMNDSQDKKPPCAKPPVRAHTPQELGYSPQ
jgi:hypothetical protein